MVVSKLRIRFRKDGDLRLVSHHDLLRCLERMLRRAGLPFCSTQGFNPKPRIVFALSLALGIIGHQEVVELELEEDIPAEEACARLARQAPAGLTILTARAIDPKRTAQVSEVTYRLAALTSRFAESAAKAAGLLRASNLWIERSRPRPRRVDVRPYLSDLRLGQAELEMDLRVTPSGTARPDEVLQLLGLEDLLQKGAVLERTRLIIEDEHDGRVPGASSTAAQPFDDSPVGALNTVASAGSQLKGIA
jgi:radical SAM-linked protein